MEGLVLLVGQEAFLFQFDGAELFRQPIAAGDEKVRIDQALLFQLGQESLLTGKFRDLIVECHNVPAPEEAALPGFLEVPNQLMEDGQALVPELVVQAEGCRDNSSFQDRAEVASVDGAFVSTAGHIPFIPYIFGAKDLSAHSALQPASRKGSAARFPDRAAFFSPLSEHLRLIKYLL